VELWREVGEVDGALVAEEHGAFDDVFELADVAGPGVGEEGLHGEGGDVLNVEAHAGVVEAHEEADELWDVLGALAEGGEVEVDDFEAVVEVFAEGGFVDHGLEVAVGGGEDLYVDADEVGAADAAEGLLFDGAEELGLDVEGHGGDFVEEEDAAVGDFHEAVFALFGAGEGAGFVAEELGFEDGVLDGGAVDGDEGFVVAGTSLVDGVGEDFFAGAGGAGDEDGDGGGGGALGLVHDGVHGGAAADDEVEVFVLGAAEVEELAAHSDDLAGALDGFFEGGELDGFLEEVYGAVFHGGDGHVDVAVGGDDDDGGTGGEVGGFFEEAGAVAIGEVYVEEDDIALTAAHEEAGFFEGGDGEGFIAAGAEEFFDVLAGAFFVVYDQDGKRHDYSVKGGRLGSAVGGWDEDLEGGAAGDAGDLNGATVGGDDVFGDGEAEAGAGGVGGEEGLEDFFFDFVWNAAAGV
jgi:hypothetical protein